MSQNNSINAPLPLSLAKGGTGAVLVDPNADRILFWDDSAGSFAFLTPGSNLSISGTTLNASGGGGTATITEYEADFGATKSAMKQFTVTDAAVSPSSLIIATMSGAAPTGKDADEVTCFETGFDLYCTPGSGDFVLTMRARQGFVTGKFKINYIVG